MRKVLILAYDFPPYFSMGAQRPWSWYLYFKESGFYPIVVTRHWDEEIKTKPDTFRPTIVKQKTIDETDYGTLIKVPYNPGFRDRLFIKFGEGKLTFLRQFFSFFQSIMQFVSLRFDGKNAIFWAADEYLQKNKVDFLTATGEPFVLFRHGMLLSAKHKIPWLADYRDCWSNFHEISGKSGILERFFQNNINRYFEKKIVRTCSLVSCPGIITKEKIRELFPDKDIRIIYNGFFDEEYFEEHKKKNETKELIISFGGTIYPFQPLELFLDGLLNAIEIQGNLLPVKVRFFGGAFFEDQKKRIKKLKKIHDFIEVTTRLTRKELLANYAKSDFLLLFSNKKMISGKLFDYIKVGKPIILVGEDGGEMEEIILKNNLGFVLRTKENVAEFLLSQSNLRRKVQPKETQQIDDIVFFSRRIQAKILCEAISGFLLHEENLKQNLINSCPVCQSIDLKNMPSFQATFLNKCRNCGFVFSKKKPGKETLDHFYQNYSYTDAYYSSPLTKIRYEEILDKMESYRKNNKFLDVGCGNGDFLMVARERGWDCWGTEYSEKAVEVCQKKGLNVLHGSLEELATVLPEFDVVVSIEVIEHINNPAEEINIIKELLRSGGLFYLTTPNFNSIMRYFLKGKFDVITYPEHLGYFSPKSISWLMEKNGFKKVKLVTTGFSFNRLINSLFGKVQDPFTPQSIDEKFRMALDANIFLRAIKGLGDSTFNFFGTGLSIKAWFEKKSLGD